ncbi:MAG: tRNA (adenosine(37)-N6)-threonylcarbamoyltransferase complex dimerization subunit type 1 TsaB [Bacilli bacterium]|nr:tRNA (adenosine(37)-N6)-threonylcarbamoyltransferase complex dimerization subunit type 1 TsaB [Bacilli bacterium]
MNTIFISTFNQKVIIGILKNEILLLKEEITSNKSHSISLIPTIEKVLTITKTKLNDLNEIIIINGPGSFTGVRLGVTVAKTLSYTLKIKIKTITSIEAIAISSNADKKIVIIPDSKGKYLGIFNNNKLIKEINYLNNIDYNLLIKNYKNYKIIESEYLDIPKIVLYLKDKKSINPHSVKPMYIKKIEVLNGK